MVKRFTAVLAAAVVLIGIFPARAYVAATPSPLVEVKPGDNTKVYGYTAQESLGKKTGTLAEFASVVGDNTESYVLFPANFFNAYEDSREVFGGIYSQGRIVFDSWMDYGCGFDANGKFYLFKLISRISNEKDGKIIINDGGKEVEIITAFNCYPWLVQNGRALDITPTPAADANFLNSKRQRAFMGQKQDGTFVYGMLPSATMKDVQETCIQLGLVNAVNTDGGASCGVYQDGRYLAHPGRELASVVLIAKEKPPAVRIVDIVVNEVKLDGAEAYIKDDRTVAPVALVAQAFGFESSWNSDTQTSTLKRGNDVIELKIGSKTARFNGEDVELTVAPFLDVQRSRNYVPVADMARLLGITHKWDGESYTVYFTT